jgi:hypothetical protein
MPLRPLKDVLTVVVDGIKLYAQPVKISTGFHSCQDPTSFEYGISGLFEKYYGRRKQSDLTIISDLLYGKYSNKNVRK